MRDFLEKNKTMIALLVTGGIIGSAIYFSEKPKKSLVCESTVSSGPESVDQKIQKQINSCSSYPELPDGAKKLVTKIIDGDTFLIEGGYSVRILGIDADEREHSCFEAAKNRLEELILNKEVKLEKEKNDFDQYCRYLRYVFLPEENRKEEINIALQLVKEGLAVARLSPEVSKYRQEISLAEKEARLKSVGCKWQQKDLKNQNEIEGSERGKWENLTEEKTKLKTIGACQAENYSGKEMIVEGKVVSTYRSKKGNVFLNFEKPYPHQCFSAVIFSPNLSKFGENPEKNYNQKILRVRGKIRLYQGKPEIILNDVSQVEIGK
jgi:micrococcal nuclease